MRPTDQELLELYALYKQGTVGDVNTPCPSFFKVTGRKKWSAWESKKDMDMKTAREKYVEFANTLVIF